jgi:hypothetical protein
VSRTGAQPSLITHQSSWEITPELSNVGATVKPRYKHTLGTNDHMLISQVMLIPRGI